MPAHETLSPGALVESDFHSLPSKMIEHFIVPVWVGFPAVNTTTNDCFAFIVYFHGSANSSALLVEPSSFV